MTTGHLDELRQLARDRAERRTDREPPPGAATTLEAIDLLNGMVRWRDASPEARRLARAWGDRPPADEPPR